MLADSLKTLAPPLLVRERAVEQLRTAILTGDLAPGTRLIEREMCEAMGISRASAREILRLLEAERLIEMEPRRGPIVATLTRRQAAELYDIRAMLEAMLVERFTARATPQDIQALREIFAEVRLAATEPDAARRIVGVIQRFNARLMAVAAHGTAQEILEGLNARLSWLRLRAMARPGRIAASLPELDAVLRAIEAGDGALAARLMRDSAANACAAALAQLEEDGLPAAE